MLGVSKPQQLLNYINSLPIEEELYWHSKNKLYKETRVATKFNFDFTTIGEKYNLRGVKYNKPKQSFYRLTKASNKEKHSYTSIAALWFSITFDDEFGRE
ncbi:hypothetical protein [Ilyobacter sp.]|uniref:hypothetical protein n=1 Tax=Ilyobacter sp. TaxID=3100343 RepID=UPI00356661DB